MLMLYRILLLWLLVVVVVVVVVSVVVAYFFLFLFFVLGMSLMGVRDVKASINLQTRGNVRLRVGMIWGSEEGEKKSGNMSPKTQAASINGCEAATASTPICRKNKKNT
jgi:hypothetical protein